MVIEVECEKGSDVETEYKLGIKVSGQKRRIETVQTLYDDDRAVVESQLVTIPLAHSSLEVEGGELYLFTVEERTKVLAEEFCVDRIDVLEVNRTVGSGLKLISVDVVVIEAHEYGLLAVYAQLGGETVCRGGLTR